MLDNSGWIELEPRLLKRQRSLCATAGNAQIDNSRPGAFEVLTEGKRGYESAFSDASSHRRSFTQRKAFVPTGDYRSRELPAKKNPEVLRI